VFFFKNKEDYRYIEIAIVGILHPQDNKIHGYRLTDISFKISHLYIYVSKNDYFRYDTNGICVYEKYGLIFLMISDDFHKMVGVIFHILFLKIGSMAVDD